MFFRNLTDSGQMPPGSKAIHNGIPLRSVFTRVELKEGIVFSGLLAGAVARGVTIAGPSAPRPRA